jgi:formylglycine-generating enzyme required for sulfatase activity
MKFAPVGDVKFSIWLTRVQDFEAFANAVGLKSAAWKQPGFTQEPTHPVVKVSWKEATAFCKWLTQKERKEGTLPANLVYRLPTDAEWSQAVGLPFEKGRTAQSRDMDVPGVYPWGTQWPPPAGFGNFTGEETGSDASIKGYNDGYAWTSPVGTFPPNKYGLCDMGGNAWQWCMDWWNEEKNARVLRGSSWCNSALNLSVLSSCRFHAAPESSADNYGFRCVLAPEGYQ